MHDSASNTRPRVHLRVVEDAFRLKTLEPLSERSTAGMMERMGEFAPLRYLEAPQLYRATVVCRSGFVFQMVATGQSTFVRDALEGLTDQIYRVDWATKYIEGPQGRATLEDHWAFEALNCLMVFPLGQVSPEEARKAFGESL